MAITISGENNNDRILAADGVIDHLSGINIVGVVTATSFSGDFNGNLTGNVTGNINNSTLLLQTGSTERVRIDSSGRVLIGTSTEGRVEADDLTIATSGSTGITLRSNAGSAGNIMFSDGTSGNDELRGILQYHHLDDRMSFSTNAVRRLTIDSVGRLLLHSDLASRNVGTKTGQLQVINTGNDATISIIQNNNAASAPFLCFGKTRSGDTTGSTIVQNNDSLGQILFCGADGTDVDSIGAWILAQVDGTPGSNDMPGRLIFSTTADGSGTPTERLRITSAGDVGIGNNAPDTSYGTNLNVHSAGGNTGARIKLSDGTSGTGNVDGFDLLGINGRAYVINRENYEMYFSTNNLVRMRINSGGQVNIGNNITQTSKLFYVDGSAEFTSNITCTNQVYINGTAPQIVFTDTNQDSDYTIKNDFGSLQFIDRTNSNAVRLYANTGGFGGDRLYIANDIVHTGDTDTKIAFTDNQIDFQCAGASSAYINNYALYIKSGFPLAFLASSGPTPNIKSGGTNNQDLLFTTGSGNPTRLQITSAGLVGINCTPVGMFEVQKNGVPAIIANYNNSKHIQMGAGGSGAGFHLTDGNFFTINHQPYANRGSDANLTERFRIHASGAVTKPNNPSFRINRTVGNNYTSTTGEILPWNVVEWDKTNVAGYGYDTSTYKYRVAVAGVYWFHCSVYTDANIDVMFDICKNTTGGFIQRAELRQTGNDDIGNNTIVHCAGLSQCAVGDYIFCYNSGGTNIELIGGNAEGYVDFSGYLVG